MVNMANSKAKDVWKLLTGEEEIIETEPQEEDYIVYLGGDTVTQGRTLRSALTPPNTGDAPQQQRPTTDPTRSVLKWQAAYKKWERSQGKVRDAIDLLAGNAKRPPHTRT